MLHRSVCKTQGPRLSFRPAQLVTMSFRAKWNISVAPSCSRKCAHLCLTMAARKLWQTQTALMQRAACANVVRRCAARRLPAAVHGSRIRRYSFATEQYNSAFGDLPQHDTAGLREATIAYMRAFEAQKWFDEPIQTIIHGVPCAPAGETLQDTVDAAGRVNGKQLMADEATMEKLVESIATNTAAAHTPLPPHVLLEHSRKVRAIEQKLLSHAFASELVGNQAMDFLKQDGLTEILESVQANHVERKLNDMLLHDESEGLVRINRAPVFVACVSNFSNFLDLFRKTVRSLEAGVPCVVLSRSNTSQHCFRWFTTLVSLLKQEQLPPSLLTFASCSVAQQRQLFKAFPASPVHFTGSRAVAAAIKSIAPRTLASTGGPNTMVVLGKVSEQVSEAIRMSACIENSGQCTALRHVVVAADNSGGGEVGMPQSLEEEIAGVFRSVRVHPSEAASLKEQEFAALLAPLARDGEEPAEGYRRIAGADVAVRFSDMLPAAIDEHWRRVYLDVTRWRRAEIESAEGLARLGNWLDIHQPISLAVNGDYETARVLWERSGVVVFTAGTLHAPALSCQARPQDGECFGELPPRAQLTQHTRFPMLVPTAVSSYNAVYTPEALAEAAHSVLPGPLSYLAGILHTMEDQETRGYCMLLLHYLADACRGPWQGHGSRTILYGLQRPPLGKQCLVRVGAGASEVHAWPYLLPFLATTARGQLQVSIVPDSPAQAVLEKWLGPSGVGGGSVRVCVEGEAAFHARAEGMFNVIELPAAGDGALVRTADGGTEFPLVAQFVSTLMVADDA